MRYRVRPVTGDDFEALRQLEADIFGGAGYALLCPHYLRVCTEFFAETCFLALEDERPVGFVLCFVREREAYSTRLGVRSELQGTGAAMALIGALIGVLVEGGFDRVWFTVKPNNTHARALYARLGATELGLRRDFLAPGDELLVQELDRAALERFHRKYARLQG